MSDVKMGGNALSQPSLRLNKTEYSRVVISIYYVLKQTMNFDNFSFIKSYTNKQSFGDCDVIIKHNNHTEFFAQVKATKIFSEHVQNANVMSCNLNGFQIDFVVHSDKVYNFAQRYYAFNDLGNLIGRISRAMGFKFGHNGLFYTLYDQNDKDRVVAELLVTDNFYDAVYFLGFNPSQYISAFEQSGYPFTELEDIFKYVVSSHYFNKKIFSFDNRNHHARVRDRKRKVYMQFLEYCETFDGPTMDRYDKNKFLQKAFLLFPQFECNLKEANVLHEQNKQVKQVFNGNIVAEACEHGITGKELGKFIGYLKSLPEFDDIVSLNSDIINTWIKNMYNIWTADVK